MVRHARKVALAPKRGPQLALSYEQRDKNGQRRIGRGIRAGRKRKVFTLPPGKKYVPHLTRADVDPRHPQHVTLRVVGDIAHLRTRDMYAAVKRSLRVSANRADFRIVHHSVQGEHIHLLVEADSKAALAAGMKGFEVSLAKRINAVMTWKRREKRRGHVFADRYHVTAITSVRGTRNALCYILNNWRHHPRSARGPRLLEGRLDPYSSAIWFAGWKEKTVPEIHVPPDYDPPPRCDPRSWLLTTGLKLAPAISCWEVPG